ncbi:S-methyl-5'-thioadenosine phosphorylase [Halodesulfurarchaeum formicicum]|uniref:Purine nucleoside phosphorylase n=1 Tax=Halodesulfurarchaeum formicicum TaxID=1873524 RepID=A0A1J1ADY4_9EURY|nr:S-methyl-5'-thioadenosine phosphorylase [Halodesulfurarchaeum formicicum]APE95935.1 5'-methylthioadenosine phosphorylase [Halodesulfurarchaeum formicicum]
MIGFIGGSGIYEALPLTDVREREIETPFGEPSAPVTIGTYEGTETEVAFIPRHGRHHQYSPTDLPYRANIYAFKTLGVERVIASNAVGSLRKEIEPRTLVVPDQLFDRTRHREYSFFGEGMVVHQGFAEPFCPELSKELQNAAVTETDASVKGGGTYVTIEGPQFSTRAESEFYREQGFDIIGMTAIPEAKLAREAELCYATVAGVTDWDVWKTDSQVSLEEVLENASHNEAAIQDVVGAAIESLSETRSCECGSALEGTINTDPEHIPESTLESVEPLVEDYL